MNEDELRTHQKRMLDYAETIIERNEFSVCQFFVDGHYGYLKRFVSSGEAVSLAKRAMKSDNARAGVITRILITDGGDSIAFEWRYGQGVTFPALLFGFGRPDDEDAAS